MFEGVSYHGLRCLLQKSCNVAKNATQMSGHSPLEIMMFEELHIVKGSVDDISTHIMRFHIQALMVASFILANYGSRRLFWQNE